MSPGASVHTHKPTRHKSHTQLRTTPQWATHGPSREHFCPRCRHRVAGHKPTCYLPYCTSTHNASAISLTPHKATNKHTRAISHTGFSTHMLSQLCTRAQHPHQSHTFRCTMHKQHLSNCPVTSRTSQDKPHGITCHSASVVCKAPTSSKVA